jgi:hypothetical protein
MKKGKELKIQTAKNYNVVYGSVNNKNPKALYINISAWAEPKNEAEINYRRIIRDSDKKIRQIIYNSLDSNTTTPFLKDRTIMDYDIRESGLKYGKRSFVGCEITIYMKYEIPINSDFLKPIVNDLINTIIDLGFEENKYFKFYKKKK